jgi:tRNA threonylcarbamoyladenosine biosynthesis protein TsaE
MIALHPKKSIGSTYMYEDLSYCAQKVFTKLAGNGSNVIALHGDLGAGKTTLVSYIAKELGITESIVSPTFVIYRKYAIGSDSVQKDSAWNYLIHIDAYRLTGEEDGKKIRLEELCADPTNLVCIEWPEHVGTLVPKNALHVYLMHTTTPKNGCGGILDEYEREIEIR